MSGGPQEQRGGKKSTKRGGRNQDKGKDEGTGMGAFAVTFTLSLPDMTPYAFDQVGRALQSHSPKLLYISAIRTTLGDGQFIQ